MYPNRQSNRNTRALSSKRFNLSHTISKWKNVPKWILYWVIASIRKSIKDKVYICHRYNLCDIHYVTICNLWHKCPNEYRIDGVPRITFYIRNV